MNEPLQEEDRLEQLLTDAVRTLPSRRAPHTLESRVLEELARRAQLLNLRAQRPPPRREIGQDAPPCLLHLFEESDHCGRLVGVAEPHLRAGALAGVSFNVESGEIVGIAGLAGSGRDSVLGASFGALPRAGGDVLHSGE